MDLSANLPLAIEPFLRKMVNRNQQDIVSLWRIDGLEVWFVSPAFEQVFGYSSTRLYENAALWSSAVITEDRLAYEIFRSKLETSSEALSSITYRIQRADQRVSWVEERRWFLHNEYGEVVGIGSLARDVTSVIAIQTQLQNELDRMQQKQAQLSQWIQQQSDLILHHLQTITTNNENLQNWPVEAKRCLAESQHQLQQALDILEDTRRYFSPSVMLPAQPPRVFNLFALLESVQDVLAPTLNQHGVRFLLNVQDNAQGNYLGQPEQLKQFLRHLILELLSPYTARVLLIIVECIESTANAVLLRFTLRITVESPTKTRETEAGRPIYQELVTSLSEEMGLHVNRTTHHFGEEITFEAEYVRASATKPIHQEQNQPSMTPATKSSKPVAHALVIEDNNINQHLVSIILKEIGCSADFVSDGLQALALADRDYDFILVDIGLPGMDGFEVAHQLKQHFKEKKVPIIGMSAHMSVGTDDRDLLGPLDDFVYKPFGIANVSALLEKWVIKHEARSQAG